MTTTIYDSARGQRGFTLVELAVVMIIIGLLIGGILKGQEMIANAQITATVAEMKSMDAAASTFRDQYDAFPGDMTNANTRLTGCTASPCWTALGAGVQGNGRIDNNVGALPALTTESVYFFNQMRVANLIGGFDGTNTLAFSQALPTTASGGGYTIGSANVGVTGFAAAEIGTTGHFLVLTGAPAAVVAGQGLLSASEAARVDRKMDDGVPSSGIVVSDTANGSCRLAGAYNEATASSICVIAVRIQS